MICSYATSKGSALVYTTTVDNVVYQGEGTSGSIAKAIAASKALAGINVCVFWILNFYLFKKCAN